MIEEIVSKVPVTTYEEKVTGIRLDLTIEQADYFLGLLGGQIGGGLCGSIFIELLNFFRSRPDLGIKSSSYKFETQGHHLIRNDSR